METVTRQERDMGILVHCASFAGYLIPFGNVLGPLIVYLMKREDSPFIEACGKNCLNFQISMVIYAAVCLVLAFVLIGFVLLGVLGLFNLIVTVIAAIKASEGKVYHYPLAIRFLK
ncbi:hypothetical protein HR45_15150 [Shewanella mangrovi]|uniref:Orotate phosphoribosyltransferase n=1 Tax=Shewanella mangrovi TaxID=1515746 RepID=A0A094JBJ2_9GAMM|nr:DUF4870 domain-containing protein [Shewanella mangrovi]KFZ36632.1 hypothetical protein HR45_15150 [Shewanella mangrovi]